MFTLSFFPKQQKQNRKFWESVKKKKNGGERDSSGGNGSVSG